MRRLAACAVLLLAPSPASAASVQITDPAGDANAAEVAVAPAASMAAFDITAVKWWSDASAQRVSMTFTEARGEGRFVLSWATPACETMTLEWRHGSEWSYLKGCKPRHARWPAVPKWTGTTLTFTIPRRDLPSWLAPGTTLTRLAASAAPVYDFRNGQLHPAVDTATSATAKYVVGS